MKKSVPNWVWIVMGILVVVIITQSIKNNTLADYYYGCVLEKIDETSEYIDLSQDYLELLICYQK